MDRSREIGGVGAAQLKEKLNARELVVYKSALLMSIDGEKLRRNSFILVTQYYIRLMRFSCPCVVKATTTT